MPQPDEKPPLSKSSDAWVHLRSWILKRITQLHEELEVPGGQTDVLRGQIAELRHIIRAVEPELPDSAEPSYFPPGNSPS